MNTIEKIKDTINTWHPVSAWDRGVKEYALELVGELDCSISDGYFPASDLADLGKLEKQLLNGAENWKEFSWGGSSLIYNYDIAQRLCTPSALKRSDHGFRRPNNREHWLDVQARALYQAALKIRQAAANATR